MTIPEKYAADGAREQLDGGAGQKPGFRTELQALYSAAGGSEVGYKQLVSLGRKHGFAVSPSILGEWLGDGSRKSVPSKPDNVRYVLEQLIPFLEARAAQRSSEHQRTSTETWKARLTAAQAVSKSGQGGRGRRVHAASAGRLFGVPSQTLQDVLPHDFIGREEELHALSAFVTAPDGSPAYVWWQAGAWAGKTALLAWFATRRLPAGVDVIHHFVARRLGTNSRTAFLLAVGEQLASVAGRKIRTAERGEPSQLPALFEDAARASAARHRRLVLIVDGLDEDADAALGSQSIAALLPKQPPHGMRVIVSGRRHPQVAPDVAEGHPLRDAGIVRRLAPSPAAQVIRDTAMQELTTLLDDTDVGSRLLGLLVVAEGALTGADMADLVGVRPYEVQRRLRSVIGRNMTPTNIDHVALNPPPDVDTEARRQTFVLAHEELRKAAASALGKKELATCKETIHSWADHFREGGWPEDTPNYLLTGYTRLVQQNPDADRLADIILDPRRQRRLIQRSGLDVALADLALVGPPDACRTPPSLVTTARTAVSRQALLAHAQPLPRSVARTVALLGDARRARSLAGASPTASVNAERLADVARVLADTRHKQAGETARTAAEWAATALREADLLEHPSQEAEGAAVQAALALLATDQVPAGLQLLHAARGWSTARYEAWAEAAILLARQSPQLGQQLLDKLEEEAEELAAEPGHGSAVAVQLWEAIAAVAPGRANRVHARALDHAREVWNAARTLEHTSVLAAVASLLAGKRPHEAAELAELARRHIETVLLDDTKTVSAADAFHIEYGFHHTLTRIHQALIDTGTRIDEVDILRARIQQNLPRCPEAPPTCEDEDGCFEVAESLAADAFRLAGSGREVEAKERLDEALAFLPTSHPDTGRAPLWLSELAGALVRIEATEDAESLLDLWQDPAGRARAHAAMALAYVDGGLFDKARSHAHQAAAGVCSADTEAAWSHYNEGTWAHAAQALACAGEGEAALALIRRHPMPADRSRKSAWRKADRLARIAVASGIVAHAPETADELLVPLLNELYATRTTPRGVFSLLARFAELLPAATAPECQNLLDNVKEAGLTYSNTHGPETWMPETVLVHALLLIDAGEDPSRQVHWLTQDMVNRGPEHFPTAAFALVHATLGDLQAALRVAEKPSDPRTRATALTAVAGHLARIPVRPAPSSDPAHPDPFTRTIGHLVRVTSPTTADETATTKFLHQSLHTVDWHQALPVLAGVEPEAVRRARDIAVGHALLSDEPLWGRPHRRHHADVRTT